MQGRAEPRNGCLIMWQQYRGMGVNAMYTKRWERYDVRCVNCDVMMFSKCTVSCVVHNYDCEYRTRTTLLRDS